MEDKIKDVDNHELLQIYNLIKEHIDYLEKEKTKVLEDDNK